MRKTQWPPIDWLWSAYACNAAWYSGDPASLRRESAFWKTGEKHKVHVPIAADIAALSAGLIFSGSPTIKSDDKKTDKRLQELLQLTGFYQKMLQGAEEASAFGGVFLKIDWDDSLAKHPILSVVPGSSGLPMIKNGINTENTFWSIVRTDEKTQAVWRWEQHYTSDGNIESKLYKGDKANLGSEVALDSIDETQEVEQTAISGTGMLMSVYIPNRLPNRLMPHSPYGASDYEGLYRLFDALDETYTALMRDVRLGKARLIVPVEYLRQKGACLANYDQASSKQWVFEGDDEYFTALDINPQDGGSPITAVQPEVRSAQYLETIEDLTRKTYQTAGYSPQSAGMDIAGTAESGTALNIRERRSMQTAEAKKTYWWQALMRIVPAILALDKVKFKGGENLDAELTVAFADATQPDMATMADTVSKLDQAEAISTDQKVRMVHPDWDDAQIEREVRRILSEKGEVDVDEGEDSLLDETATDGDEEVVDGGDA